MTAPASIIRLRATGRDAANLLGAILVLALVALPAASSAPGAGAERPAATDSITPKVTKYSVSSTANVKRGGTNTIAVFPRAYVRPTDGLDNDGLDDDGVDDDGVDDDGLDVPGLGLEFLDAVVRHRTRIGAVSTGDPDLAANAVSGQGCRRAVLRDLGPVTCQSK